MDMTYLIRVDERVEVVPVLHGDATRHVGDSHAAEPFGWQGSGQCRDEEVGLCELAKDVGRHVLGRLPLERVLAQGAADEVAACGLDPLVGLVKVRGWDAIEPRRLGERDIG